MFTRPRGSRNVTLESLDVALKVLNASANDSPFVFPNVGTVAAWLSVCVVEPDMPAAGLNRPVHDFGVDQALGAGAVGFISSVFTSSESAGV